jgi:hypothetical protein
MADAPRLRALQARLLGDHNLQFDYSAIAATRRGEAPEWLKALTRVIGKAIVATLPVLKVLFWIGVAAAVILIALLIAREVFGIRLGFRRTAAAPRAAPSDWRPEAWKARALLEEADRLAALGDYDRAARVILWRGIEDIEARRPRLIRPALTARDIAGLEGVPAPAREAFSLIARAVEASWFGARSLGPDDFARCRQAYKTFAFPEAWA